MIDRLSILKSVLWTLVGVWLAVTVVRFVHGLGATTNLSDATPWGLWIGFDVMAGVALAAGGFVLAATVYIFGLEKYRPFVRPAILTAFLGYVAVAVGLLYDLGLPWNIWHPMIDWQYHSVLFEVAMCVMLYLTVLALEFAPVLLEHPRLDRPIVRRVLLMLRRITLPLVIAGIMLSTLHQSSLGSLFLIAPHRLHPLWYSPIIYVLFLVSAVGLGLMMVTLESLLTGYFFRHRVRLELLSHLGLAAAVVLGIYTVLRLGDLAVRGVLGSAFDGSWQGSLFIVEIAVCAVIPACLLAVPAVRKSSGGLALCASMTVIGMVMNRIDVCIVAFARPANAPYFPSWTEIAVSLGIVSAAVLVFIFFVERLRVYDHPLVEDRMPVLPSFDPATLRGLLPATQAAPRRYSLLVLIAATATVLLLPREAVLGVRPRHTPALAPRTIEGVVLHQRDGSGRVLRIADTDEDGYPCMTPSTLLMIDGNRNGRLTLFDHLAHQDRLGGQDSCGTCHHMNMPLEKGSSCHECHRDMYGPTRTFDHALHVRTNDGNSGCVTCHRDRSVAKTIESAKPCIDCHEGSLASDSIVDRPDDRWNLAVGYMDAMHGLCIRCHEIRAEEEPAQFREVLQECQACHDADETQRLRRMVPGAQPPLDEGARLERVAGYGMQRD